MREDDRRGRTVDPGEYGGTGTSCRCGSRSIRTSGRGTTSAPSSAVPEEIKFSSLLHGVGVEIASPHRSALLSSVWAKHSMSHRTPVNPLQQVHSAYVMIGYQL
ncbi:MAG: hypothetical protein MZV64_31635 [Ignavibacteriales bacterium]|nr:hypothetical protein [Ignavibacteriales bacterium]